MKLTKYIKYIAVSVIIAMILASMSNKVLCAMDITLQTSMQRNGRSILIDPGHGGSDPGAVSKNGTKESLLNIQVSMYLMEYLKNYGYDVILTRGMNTEIVGADEGLSNAQRKNIISKTNCDVFVSIHMNKYSDPSVHGAETLYYSESEDSKLLAETIQKAMKNYVDKDNKRSVKAKDDLFVLKASKAPSVLVECGYISNPTEEAKLVTVEYQRKIAYAICCGIMVYCNSSNV